MGERAVQIGELSERTGVSRRSLRYYESRGLLPARRTRAGWREFDEAAVTRVRNVRELLDAGLTVDDIGQVAPCLDGDDLQPCERAGEAIRLHEARLRVIEGRIAELHGHREHLRQRITRLRGSTAHGDAPSAGPGSQTG